jgi:flagella basal body P-ring formation protein FlgA
MRIAIILAAVTGLARGACVSVPFSKIAARDIARSVPLFEQLDPETPIGFAPFPGTQHVLSSRELFLIAAGHGLSFPAGAPAPSLCVQRAVRLLTAEEMRPVLLSALGVPDVQMEILEVSDQLVPPGRLEFRREELNRPRMDDPQSPVIWRGQFIYDGQHSLSIWAKVRMAVSRDVVVASQDISAGAVIRVEQVKTIVRHQFPALELALNAPPTMEQIAGKMARRTIATGERIVPSVLEDAKDVVRGETVHVKVVEGAATVTLDGVAQSSGAKGESILVHNPSSGRDFRALIEGRGRAIVVSSPESTL